VWARARNQLFSFSPCFVVVVIVLLLQLLSSLFYASKSGEWNQRHPITSLTLYH